MVLLDCKKYRLVSIHLHTSDSISENYGTLLTHTTKRRLQVRHEFVWILKNCNSEDTKGKTERVLQGGERVRG